jgi:hypothetical protein
MISASHTLRLAVVLTCLGLAAPAVAGPPSYLLLRQPQAPAANGHRGVAGGVGHEVRTYGYAYGWFGAAPRTHSQRHFGYYRHYTQWSRW